LYNGELEFSGFKAQSGGDAVEPFISEIGTLFANGAMWPEFVIVSTPILHLNAGVVKTHEPMGVQAPGSELAIDGEDGPAPTRFVV